MTRLPILTGPDVARGLYPRRENVIPLPQPKKEPAPLDRPGSVTHKEQTPVNESTVPPPYAWERDVPGLLARAKLADWERDVPRAELDMGEGFDAIRARAKLAEVAGTLDLPDASSMSVARHAGEAARLAHALSQELEYLARNASPRPRVGQALLDVDRIDRLLWRIRSAAIAEQGR